MLADGIEPRLQEVGSANPGDFDRVLKGQEDALASAVFRGHLQQILPFKAHLAGRDLIGFPSSEDMCQGALARAIRTHNGMDLAGIHRQIDSPQDFVVADLRV